MGINFCCSSCSGIYTASNPVSFGCSTTALLKVQAAFWATGGPPTGERNAANFRCSPRNVFYCFATLHARARGSRGMSQFEAATALASGLSKQQDPRCRY